MCGWTPAGTRPAMDGNGDDDWMFRTAYALTLMHGGEFIRANSTAKSLLSIRRFSFRRFLHLLRACDQDDLIS